MQQEISDVTSVMKIWWDDWHTRSVGMDGYKLFRRDWQGRRGFGVGLNFWESFDYLELIVGDDRVECLWTRVREGQQGQYSGGKLLLSTRPGGRQNILQTAK